MKNSKVAVIPVSKSLLFFRWLELTRPLHNLKGNQLKVLAWLLYYYYDYKKTIDSDEVIWKLVFNYDTKAKIKESVGIEDASFQNTLSILRKKGAIVNNQVAKPYIPEMDKDAKSFKLIYHFKIMNDE